jgi:hypothetical protein
VNSNYAHVKIMFICLVQVLFFVDLLRVWKKFPYFWRKKDRQFKIVWHGFTHPRRQQYDGRVHHVSLDSVRITSELSSVLFNPYPANVENMVSS